MSRCSDLSEYLTDLQLSAELDRAYYISPNPSTADRAEYHGRNERTDALRKRIYGDDLQSARRPLTEGNELFRISVRDNVTSQQVFSDPICRLAHDLNNHLSIVLGRAELMAKRFSADEQTLRELADIISATRKMAEQIKRTHCRMSAKTDVPIL